MWGQPTFYKSSSAERRIIKINVTQIFHSNDSKDPVPDAVTVNVLHKQIEINELSLNSSELNIQTHAYMLMKHVGFIPN